MPDDPDKKPLVHKLKVEPGASAVVAGTIIGDIHIERKGPNGPVDRNRLALLKRVRAEWIDGVLNQSLYKIARIELCLETKPDAVESPLSAIVQVPDRAPFVVPPDAPIVDVFDSLGQAILILGEPGTGKTTLLLELAKALLDRAFGDASHPMPVVFNLSTWPLTREPLVSWMMSELKRIGVRKRIAKEWTDEGEVLPLLDGLDEVDEVHRSACLDAINEFRSEYGLLPIAVCSRLADFEALGMKLRVHGAVVVQTLTSIKIDDYLARSPQLLQLRAAFRQDSALATLLETPLMLWVAMLACREGPVEFAKQEEPEQTRWRLWESFVSAMFLRRTVDLRYSRETALRWLSWLAFSMESSKQTIFYPEELEANWLTTRQRWLFRAGTVGCGALCALVFGLVNGDLLFSLLLVLVFVISDSIAEFGPANTLQFCFVRVRSRLRSAICSGLDYGLKLGLPLGLIGGLIAGVAKSHAEGVAYGLITGLIEGLALAIIAGLDISLSVALVRLFTIEKIEYSKVKGQAKRNPRLAEFVGVIVGLAYALSESMADLKPIDIFHLSFRKIKSRLRSAVEFGLTVGLSFGLLAGVLYGVVDCLREGLLPGVLSGTLLGLFSGFIVSLSVALAKLLIIEKVDSHRVPSQGTRDSIKNVSVMLLTFCTIFGILGLRSGDLRGGLNIGLALSLLFGLSTGGLFLIRHFVLRLVLSRSGVAPFHYGAFLHYASERLFLRKVGGGFIFTHLMLREHFVALRKL